MLDEGKSKRERISFLDHSSTVLDIWYLTTLSKQSRSSSKQEAAFIIDMRGGGGRQRKSMAPLVNLLHTIYI